MSPLTSPAPTPRPVAPASGPGYGRFLLPLVLGTMLNPLNSTMLATALPSLCHSFSRPVSEGALLITPLYLTSAIGQPLMGRLADLYRPKTINLVGFGLVLMAALLGALAPSFGWLVVSRIMLGLGTSANYPAAVAQVQQYYAARQQPVPSRTLGVIAIASQVVTVLGPALGGFLTQYFGWQSIFWVNVPWVLLALGTLWGLPAFAPRPARTTGLLATLDAGGIGLFSALLVLAFLALLHPTWRSWLALPGLLTGAGLWSWERGQARPFLDVRLLSHQPALGLVYLCTAASTYVMYLVYFSLPLWLQAVRHLTPGQTGLLLLPMSAASVGAALLLSRGHYPAIWLSIGTLGLALAGLFALQATLPLPLLLGLTLLLGTTIGVNTITTQSALNEQAPAAQKGTCFGLYRTFGYVGAILSGSQLKGLFHGGVTRGSFALVQWSALWGGLLLTGLYLLLVWQGRRARP